MAAIKMINAVVAFALEMCMLFGLGYWGWKSSGNLFIRFGLGVITPLLAAILWGIFAAPKSKTMLANPKRMLFKITLFITTAFLIGETGTSKLALALVMLAIINEVVALLVKQ